MPSGYDARCNVRHVLRDRVGGGRSWPMSSRSRGTVRYPAHRRCVHTLQRTTIICVSCARVCEVCEELLPVILRTGLSHESGMVYGCVRVRVSDVTAFFQSLTTSASKKEKILVRLSAVKSNGYDEKLRPFVGKKCNV